MVLKDQSTSKRNKNTSVIECLDEYDIEEEGFIEGDIDTGKVLSTFNFELSATVDDGKSSFTQSPVQLKTDETPAVQPQTYTSAPRGLTPPINGEHYTEREPMP